MRGGEDGSFFERNTCNSLRYRGLMHRKREGEVLFRRGRPSGPHPAELPSSKASDFDIEAVELICAASFGLNLKFESVKEDIYAANSSQ